MILEKRVVQAKIVEKNGKYEINNLSNFQNFFIFVLTVFNCFQSFIEELTVKNICFLDNF